MWNNENFQYLRNHFIKDSISLPRVWGSIYIIQAYKVNRYKRSGNKYTALLYPDTYQYKLIGTGSLNKTLHQLGNKHVSFIKPKYIIVHSYFTFLQNKSCTKYYCEILCILKRNIIQIRTDTRKCIFKNQTEVWTKLELVWAHKWTKLDYSTLINLNKSINFVTLVTKGVIC